MNQRRQPILVAFCTGESVALMIPHFAKVFTKLNPSREAFETAAQINEELKRTEFDMVNFAKQFFIDRFSTFFSLNVENGRENDPSKEK